MCNTNILIIKEKFILQMLFTAQVHVSLH